ncbi:uncharacterized protein LOC100215004 isoform X1 [Hydra vulgaris]|uniref:Uncharacterized protein LOC100215004 isoform X1 n=2 Tax=Hydra vulgaris TaxID=6087 RepID=A0ABM4C9K6_HYDVU
MEAWGFILFVYLLGLTVDAHTILEEYYCKDSTIEYGKSLKAGNAAGLFDNYGTVKNIQECTLKCCDKKKCDIAMLEGKTKLCIGVRCFNSSSCASVPAAPGEEELQIARITERGMGNFTIDKKTKKLKTHEVESRCPHNEVLYNMKLTGGLQAGKFTDIGRVKSIKTCIRYCCSDITKCDLAFMLGKRCYLVKCYSEEKCVPLPASDYAFEQKMAFVSPWLFEKEKKLIKVPSGLQQHHLQCTQSKIYSKSKLSGGTNAGKYTHIGKEKMHTCNRRCCESQDCDLAYVFGKDCFLVKCFNEEGCRVVPDEDSINDKDSSVLEKQVQYIIKRQFGVHLNEDGDIIEKKDECSLDGEIRNGTVLEKGMLAGNLKTQHGVNNMTNCIDRCCKEKKCHVALMLGKNCYSMECMDANACKSKTAPEKMKNENPVIAYVKRGDNTMAPHK